MGEILANDYIVTVNDMSFCLLRLINEYSIIIYKLNKEKSTEILLNIIDRLDSIIKMISYEELLNNYKNILQQIQLKLPILLNAFENSDTLLISDILNYEIKPILEQFKVENN